MTKLTTRFDDAFRYAHEAHRAQTRKGNGAPYVGHLMGVVSIVLDDGGSEDEAIAALLHDAVEDQGGRERLEDIRTRFGDAVAAHRRGLHRLVDRSPRSRGSSARRPTSSTPGG